MELYDFYILRKLIICHVHNDLLIRMDIINFIKVFIMKSTTSLIFVVPQLDIINIIVYIVPILVIMVAVHVSNRCMYSLNLFFNRIILKFCHG